MLLRRKTRTLVDRHAEASLFEEYDGQAEKVSPLYLWIEARDPDTGEHFTMPILVDEAIELLIARLNGA